MSYKFLDKGHPDHYRQEEIEKLAQAIRARENRLVLGLLGMGVSNLLRFLVSRDALIGRAQVTFAFLDGDTLGEDEGLEACFDALAEEVEAQGLRSKPVAGERGYKRLERLVRQMEGDPADRLVMVVDKADSVLVTANKTFYRQLKALTDLNKRVCFIIAVSPLLAEVVDPEKLLFAGRRLPVGCFNERDCKGAIAEEATRLGADFSDVQVQRRLARLAGCCPALLRAVSSAVVQERLVLSGVKQEEETLVERLLLRGDVKGRCEVLWEALDSEKRNALLFIAGGQPDPVTIETFSWLQNFGLVDKQSQIFSPIFAAFVNQHPMPQPPVAPSSPLPSSPSSPCSVKIDNGKVYKDDKEIHLRPQAFKLLEYFLANQGRVIPHSKIIRKVWEDNDAAHFGIDSQAVQNLVRELRRKLGDGFIKTYPGRGYAFICPEAVSEVAKTGDDTTTPPI